MDGAGLIFSEDMCRLCLWKGNKLLQIFSEEGEHQGIPGKIAVCLPISVSRDDLLPKLICTRCIYKLEFFCEFRNSCLRSEEVLKLYTVPENPVPNHVQDVEPCLSAAAVMQPHEDIKVEVSETESVAVVHEAPPFMCVLNEPETEFPAVEQTSEPQVQTPIIESVNSISENLTQDVSAKAPCSTVKKRKVIKKSRASASVVNKETSSTTAMKGRRNILSCKYCCTNFPSRLMLSRHLTSSNCLFRYTCRYCAKVFVSAQNKINHERNHKDKKNFMCGMCKQIFQSAFEVNVHTVQGCDRPLLNSPQINKKTEKKKPANKVPSQVSKSSNSTSQSQIYSCYLCNKVYRKNIQFQRHLRNCKRSVMMTKIQENRKKNSQIKHGQKVISSKQMENEKVVKVQPQSMRTRKPSRRKQNVVPVQDPPVVDNPNISPKASLLAVLGLREKTSPVKPKQEPEMEMETEANTGRCSPDVIVVEEVVTVCDICRKIFTSEAGMLNHQISVHNRSLTAEKIHTLMRVEI